LNRILKELSQGLISHEADEGEAKAYAAKLFKGNQYLQDLFLMTMPKVSPPESLLPEPEVIDFEELKRQNEEIQRRKQQQGDDEDEEQHQDDPLALLLADVRPETEDVPLDLSADAWGSEKCPCRCHLDVDEEGNVEEGSHCLHCAMTVRGHPYASVVVC